MDRNTQTVFTSSSLPKGSLSARRAWIEIEKSTPEEAKRRSLSARRAWIEIPAGCWRDARRASLSARRAWIEIDAPSSAPYAELSLSARRAWIEIINEVWANFSGFVALRKESVDRNLGTVQIVIIVVESLSARRAWIEIEDWLNAGSLSRGRSPQGERG